MQFSASLILLATIFISTSHTLTVAAAPHSRRAIFTKPVRVEWSPEKQKHVVYHAPFSSKMEYYDAVDRINGFQQSSPETYKQITAVVQQGNRLRKLWYSFKHRGPYRDISRVFELHGAIDNAGATLPPKRSQEDIVT
ncbi:hypothetical protein BC835DRAFT_1364445 [Cytidiella melzeri]|nr:hypothetical protein BC835DRAFT_1364445 [Cytidiella melzeri]